MATAWKFIKFLLALLGLWKPESDGARVERLTHEADKVTTLEANIEAARRKDEAEAQIAQAAEKPKPKIKAGGSLFLLALGLCLMGCAARTATVAPMRTGCPRLPLPPKPAITIPEPDGAGRYCFTEEELQAISDYGKTLRAIIEEYEAQRDAYIPPTPSPIPLDGTRWASLAESERADLEAGERDIAEMHRLGQRE